jgi:ABC-type uncharacterized transport system ATPase subunit
MDELQRLMVGEAPVFSPRPALPPGAETLVRIEALGHGRGHDTDIRDFSLTVAAGEVVGITGIRENGLRALEDLLSGMVHPSTGRVLLADQDITRWNPGRRHDLGWAYVPSNRSRRGTLASHSLGENLMARTYGALSPAGIFRDNLVRRALDGFEGITDLRDRFSEPLRNLSGGNAQRILVARELAGSPRVVLACEPAWGLDTRHRHETYEMLARVAAAGAAVIIITGDVEEALTLSDRIAVLHRGELAGIYRPEAFSHQRIASAMLQGTAQGRQP